MYPPLFTSAKQFAAYIKCVNNIEIGDSVECLLLHRGFANVETTPESYRFGGRWSHKIILPIIGRTSDPDSFFEQELYATIVGLEQGSTEVRCGYDQDPYFASRHNISKEYSHLEMYTNCDLDIIYTRIIKRKQ